METPPLSVASRLADAHIEGQRRLRRITTASVEAIWLELPGRDRENLDEWLSRVLPLVFTAQRAAVALTEAFIAQFLGRRPLGLDATKLIGAAARNGAEPSEVYARPFVTLWSALGEGVHYEDAANKALARAESTAAMDVQLAMRATANAVERADETIFGFQRVADAGACNFCRLVDGAYVKRADAMALHNFCGCGLEPLTEPHPLAAFLPSGVAVHEHGELGSVLSDPAHSFTGPDDF